MPVPVPSVDLEFATVGDELVFQQIPRAVTDAPPSEVTFPPLLADTPAIDDIAVVVTTAGVPIVPSELTLCIYISEVPLLLSSHKLIEPPDPLLIC